MKLSIALSVVGALAAAASSASADVLVGYDTSAVTTAVASVSPGTLAPHVSGLNLTRGAGLNAVNENGYFSSTGWDSADSTDYMSFGLTIDAGYSASLSQLVVLMRSANSGPGTIGVYCSADGFANPLASFAQDGSNQTDTIDLTSLGAITGTIEFRLLEVGNTRTSDIGSDTPRPPTTSGTFRITGPAISGSVSALPAPGAAALLGLSGLAGSRRRRR